MPQAANIFQLHPGIAGVETTRGFFGKLMTRFTHPADTAELVELCEQLVLQFEQMGDIDRRVLALRFRQRPPQPVGEAVTLRRVDSEFAVQDRNQRRRPIPQETTGDLRIEEPSRNGPDGVREHVEILLGSVKDSLDISIEQPPHRFDIDSKWIDQHQFVAPTELHQRQRWEVGPLAVELGIDRVARLEQQRIDDGIELGLLVDPAMRKRNTHAAPVATLRPDITHADVPPATLIASIPFPARNSHARMLRPPDLQITYAGPSPRNASRCAGTVPSGINVAWATRTSSNSASSRTSINRAPPHNSVSSSSTEIS